MFDRNIWLLCTIPPPSSPNPIDVFPIGGQSNALGQAPMSTLSQSPHVPSGKVLQYYLGSISDANDPVGNSVYGSAWPSFGITYYNATGRNVAFVPAAVGATGQSSKADVGLGNWDASGTL